MRSFRVGLSFASLIVAGCCGVLASPTAQDGGADAGLDASAPGPWSTTVTVGVALDVCAASSSTGATALGVETVANDVLDDPQVLDVWLFEPDGSIRWQHHFADRPEPFALFPGCRLAFDGEDLVVGDVRERDESQNAPLRAFLARLDAHDGHVVWSKSFGEAEHLALAGLVLGPAGLYVAGSVFNGTSELPSAIVATTSDFVALFDPKTGGVVRSAEWPVAAQRTDALALRPDGDVAVVGFFAGDATVVGADGAALSATGADAADGGAGLLARFRPDLTLRALTAFSILGPVAPEATAGRAAFDATGAFAFTVSASTSRVARFDEDGQLVSYSATTGEYVRLPPLVLTASGNAVLPFDDGLGALASNGAIEAHQPYPGADFLALSRAPGNRILAAGTLSSATDFGTGVLTPSTLPGTTTVFVVRGKPW